MKPFETQEFDWNLPAHLVRNGRTNVYVHCLVNCNRDYSIEVMPIGTLLFMDEFDILSRVEMIKAAQIAGEDRYSGRVVRSKEIWMADRESEVAQMNDEELFYNLI